MPHEERFPLRVVCFQPCLPPSPILQFLAAADVFTDGERQLPQQRQQTEKERTFVNVAELFPLENRIAKVDMERRVEEGLLGTAIQQTKSLSGGLARYRKRYAFVFWRGSRSCLRSVQRFGRSPEAVGIRDRKKIFQVPIFD